MVGSFNSMAGEKAFEVTNIRGTTLSRSFSELRPRLKSVGTKHIDVINNTVQPSQET